MRRFDESVCSWYEPLDSLQGRHHERDCVSNHRRLDCLLNHLCRRRSRKTSKLPVTGLCEGNSPVTDAFQRQRASNKEMLHLMTSSWCRYFRWYGTAWHVYEWQDILWSQGRISLLAYYTISLPSFGRFFRIASTLQVKQFSAGRKYFADNIQYRDMV